MKKLLGIGFFFSVVMFSGCAYNIKPVAMPALNIYSSYDERIPGTWVVVIDDSAKNVVREIRASTWACSGPKYPINVGDSIATSIKRTMDSIFENVIERAYTPSYDELQQIDAKGTVLVKMDRFEPRLRCSVVFWSGSCTASTDIEFGVIVRGQQGKLFATSVGDSATTDGDSGSFCGGAASVLSESISKSVREALERMGERLSNCPKLRKESI